MLHLRSNEFNFKNDDCDTFTDFNGISEILLIKNDEIIKVPYNELEHVPLTRDFLNNPESFLRHL